ncbi:MAG: hypothetical protein BroJett015_08010 [Chloroflexota bacterium]|nr:hypothetical protein [Ardenticatenaceae bacterium]GIK55138.1 MAG: hypothetical protein BroJett015_08010 [Chloroflexota bacterium]
MLENLMAVGVVIAIFWIALFLFYMFTSRQQQGIAADIEKLNQQLGKEAEANE